MEWRYEYSHIHPDYSIYNIIVVGGWAYPSEKYEFVSWEYDIPNIWKVIKAMFQTTNQYCNIYGLIIIIEHSHL